MKTTKILSVIGRFTCIVAFISITACNNEEIDTNTSEAIEVNENINTNDIPLELVTSNNAVDEFYDTRPSIDSKVRETPKKSDVSNTTAKSIAAQQWTVFKIDVYNQVAINYGLFGVNNDWRFIPNNDFYYNFVPSLGSISSNAIRYPGGWESEYYEASNNTTPGWSNTPAKAGASLATLNSSGNLGVVNLVIPTVDAMNQPLWSNQWWAAIQKLKDRANRLIDGSNRVDYVEIGNEWWLQWGGGVSRYDKVRKYGQIAKLLARHLRARYGYSFKILVNGDYTVPSEFSTLKTIFGNELNNIDGSALHPYAGYNSTTHNLNNLENTINQCKSNLGRYYVTQSEWAPSKAYNNNRVYAQAANIMVDMFQKFARVGSNSASYWAPENSTLPGLGLFNSAAQNVWYPQAQIFSSMAQNFYGGAAYNYESHGSQTGIIKVASRVYGKQVAFWVSGFDVGDTDVYLDFPGVNASNIKNVYSTIYYPSSYWGEQAQSMGHYWNSWFRTTTGIAVKLNSWRRYGIAYVVLDLY